MTGHWIAVASAERVRRGRDEGFMQVSHGKAAPLKRIKPGDRVVYYSPTVTLGGKDKVQAFTAIGTVKDREPYAFDMGKGFKPYRRDMTWATAEDAPIHPLLDALEFTAGKTNWGYQLRFGLFPIGEADRGGDARDFGSRQAGSNVGETLSAGFVRISLYAISATLAFFWYSPGWGQTGGCDMRLLGAVTLVVVLAWGANASAQGYCPFSDFCNTQQQHCHLKCRASSKFIVWSERTTFLDRCFYGCDRQYGRCTTRALHICAR